MPPKQKKKKKVESDKLFLSLKAYHDGDKIRLEMDFSPPFEMLEIDFDGKGKSGFQSQKAPTFYNVEQLERLFKYITKVLPCALIESHFKGAEAGKSFVAHKASGKLAINKKDTDFLGLVSAYNRWNDGDDIASGKYGGSGSPDTELETPENKARIKDMMASLRINRVHVDPDQRHTLSAQSTGGDQPPPGYPPR